MQFSVPKRLTVQESEQEVKKSCLPLKKAGKKKQQKKNNMCPFPLNLSLQNLHLLLRVTDDLLTKNLAQFDTCTSSVFVRVSVCICLILAFKVCYLPTPDVNGDTLILVWIRVALALVSPGHLSA